MPIRVYDTMRREVVDFEPRDPGRVSIYCCGMTVYNYPHIGNMRTFVWFDFIRRYLRYRGFEVTLVLNYTDVDDKIIERANIEGIPPDAVTAKYIAAAEDDMANLGAEKPDILPRATTHIEEMVEAIQKLIDKGYAYESEGNVWFEVEKFDGYGKLSGRSLDDMRAGEERIEPHASKRNQLDFGLWKAAKEGEPSWSSPWGPGRPGWHIECSVMSEKYLRMGFDIHGGGSDLIFPHHENEIAQSESLESGDTPFARYWLHAGMVQMDAEKMSKSLGNVVLARDLLERVPAEAVRYWMLQSSYRSQAVCSGAAIEDAAQSYDRWKTFIVAVRHVLGRDEVPVVEHLVRGDQELAEGEPAVGYVQRFIEAMDDDFNSAEAFAVVHEIVREGNKRLELVQRGDDSVRDELLELVRDFLELTAVLGFKFLDDAGDSELLAGLVGYLLELREQAREEKAFERSDAIRARLQDLGVVIEDTPSGPRWRVGGATS